MHKPKEIHTIYPSKVETKAGDRVVCLRSARAYTHVGIEGLKLCFGDEVGGIGSYQLYRNKEKIMLLNV